MAQNTPCERCQRVGMVHLERIINGFSITLSYYCDACMHTWQVALPDPRNTARVTLKPRKDRRESA